MLDYNKIEADLEKVASDLKEMKIEILIRNLDNFRIGLFDDLVQQFGIENAEKIAVVILQY